MIPTLNCTACPLCKTRKRIVGSVGMLPAEVLIFVDPINSTDELLGRAHSGPDRGVLENVIDEAAEIAGVGKPTIHVVPITLCRSHTDGVDRAATRPEILKCMHNVMKIYEACSPKLVILCGDAATTYYGNEFEESISLKPSWFIRKYPAYWINAVSTVAEGLRRCL